MRSAVTSIPGDEGRAAVRRPRRPPDPDPAAADGGGGAGHQPRAAGRSRSRRRCRRPACRKFEVAQPRDRRPGDRRRPAAEGHLRDAGLAPRASPCYIAFRFRLELRASAPSWPRSTTSSSRCPFLTFFGYDLSLNVVAAILTITGYSVNDTIVIFDRVRENLRVDPARAARTSWSTRASTRRCRGPSSPPAPRSCRCCRCTSSAARCCAAFAFTMLVGIVSGTYSTVFIASAIAIILSQRGSSVAALRRPRRRGGDAAPGRKSGRAKAS